MKPNPDRIEQLIANQDTLGLLHLLRIHPEPDVRSEAASRLPEMDGEEIIEGLIRAFKLDPDPTVKRSARAALERVLGTNASQAIAAYGDIPGDEMEYENALRETQQGTQAGDEDSSEYGWDGDEEEGSPDLSVDQVSALVSIVSDDRHPERQIKALNILANHPTLDGNNAITSAALWSENAMVRQHARNILESIYGEELPAYLAEFQQSEVGEEELEESDEDDSIVEDDSSPDNSGYNAANSIPSAFKEEKSVNIPQLILFILLIIILILLAQRFLLH